ncbi:hypothetical protein [Marinomonas sp. GJ51-6]|uniref:hypothetical protein n=1 Tax=Marinomonas sp. GJ51-6 TaxID=2992802 RepID=UPI00293527C4|nr:hypothetical protein [Marinomonas sp. GJ51-6]WOD08378.1 hypothetical protein ONZ50_04495 [Marinomonas sp. GJ51-6]
MWNRYRQTSEFSQPWLLRFFDQIRFYEVSHDELQQIRTDFPHGRESFGKPAIRIEESEFSLAEYQSFIEEQSDSIDVFKQTRQNAFATEPRQLARQWAIPFR